MKRWIYALGVLLVLALLVFFSPRAAAAPQSQLPQFFTPTPGPDGRIIYFVQANDTCIRVSLLTGISVEQLRSLNQLDANCTLVEGQPLLIGFGGPAAASPTPGPSPTATAVLPTPTPFAGRAEVCILLYADENGNALREEAELGIEGGAVSLTSADGSYSQTQGTFSLLDPDTEEPVRTCFAEVPQGKYTVAVGIPEGYNPTTELNNSLDIGAGQRVFIAFGAQLSSAPADEPAEGGRLPVLGLVGGALVLAGLVLAFFATRMRKSGYLVR